MGKSYMDRTVAERAIECLIQADTALNAAYCVLHEAGEAPDLDDLKRRVAMLIALIGTGLYRPLYYEHPDLCPEGLRFMLERPPRPEIDWPFSRSPTG
jgi:hypothetical protein